jgi:hypothetical protein
MVCGYVRRTLQSESDLTLDISAHQDVFSRFISGSGAPIWVLIALGLNPRRLNQTGAAVVHAQWAEEGWGGEEGKIEAGKEGFSDFPDSEYCWPRAYKLS